MKPGWYYHFEWATMMEPYYLNSQGELTEGYVWKGPFKSAVVALKHQRAIHLHHAKESKMAAERCRQQVYREKTKRAPYFGYWVEPVMSENVEVKQPLGWRAYQSEKSRDSIYEGKSKTEMAQWLRKRPNARIFKIGGEK